MVSLTFSGDFETGFQSFLVQMALADSAGLFADRFQFSEITRGDRVTDPILSFSAAFRGSFVPASNSGTIRTLEADFISTQLGQGTTTLWEFEIGGLELDLRQVFFLSGSTFRFSEIGLRLALQSQEVDFTGGAQDDVFGPNDVFTLASNDTLSGGLGSDTLAGGGGRDLLNGGEQPDVLTGGAAGDRLVGGGGNDTLNGDAGKDRLTGNGGADVFVLTRKGDADTVTDFADGDLIGLESSADFGRVKTTISGDDLILTLRGGSLKLVGGADLTLTEADFTLI